MAPNAPPQRGCGRGGGRGSGRGRRFGLGGGSGRDQRRGRGCAGSCAALRPLRRAGHSAPPRHGGLRRRRTRPGPAPRPGPANGPRNGPAWALLGVLWWSARKRSRRSGQCVPRLPRDTARRSGAAVLGTTPSSTRSTCQERWGKTIYRPS